MGVEAIFNHARAHAPCILVIEDLDTLVKPEVRSFFLNGLDGLVRITFNGVVITLADTQRDRRTMREYSQSPQQITLNSSTMQSSIAHRDST
jgi:ATP-dependent Zn protease